LGLIFFRLPICDHAQRIQAIHPSRKCCGYGGWCGGGRGVCHRRLGVHQGPADTIDRAAIVGKPDFSAIAFTVHNSKFLLGDFINAAISFLLVAAAVYFFVVPVVPFQSPMEP